MQTARCLQVSLQNKEKDNQHPNNRARSICLPLFSHIKRAILPAYFSQSIYSILIMNPGTANSTSVLESARSYNGSGLRQRLINNTTIPAVLNSLRGREAEPALTFYRDGIKTSQISYGDLLRRIGRAATFLRAVHNVCYGDRVVVMAANSPEAYIAHLAIMSIGAVTVPVKPQESDRVSRFIFDKVEPILAIVDQRATALVPARVPKTVLDDLCGRSPVLSFIAQTPHWIADAVAPDSLAVILFTSGTTSMPKGACLSHYNLLVNAEALKRAHDLDRNRTHMCVLPLFHANAFGFSMIASLYCGVHVVLCNSFPGHRTAPILAEENVNIISAVPQIIKALSLVPNAFSQLPHLRYVVSAAAPLSRETARSFYSGTAIPIRQGYGLSECVNFAATMPFDITHSTYEHLMFDWSVPSIGPELFGCNIRVQRPDGRSASAEEEGEIVISGHNVMMGYWNSPEATSQVIGTDGLKTGDIGFYAIVDGERHFFITGRSKDVIIRRGANINPLVVERELCGLEAVGDFAVVGFPNDAAGEEVGLYIGAALTPEREQSVREMLLTRCAPEDRPSVALFGRSSIPKTPTGKIQRQLLALHFRNFGNLLLGQTPLISSEAKQIDHQDKGDCDA